MTDNDIKKSLADCIKHNGSCFECPSYEFCDKNESKTVMEAVLDYIYRLEAENDRKGKIYIDLLKTSSARVDIINDLQAEKIELFEKTEQLQAENERLREYLKGCKGCKHIGFRYPFASMYPCNTCIRANIKDYYELKETAGEDNEKTI